jgi:hypothetical protein
MNQPYSLWADWLDTFQTSSEAIQALWLVAVPACLIGLALVASQVLRHGLSALASRGQGRGEARGRLVYGVYEAPDGRWLLYAGGAVRELTGDDLANHAAALRRIESR